MKKRCKQQQLKTVFNCHHTDLVQILDPETTELL